MNNFTRGSNVKPFLSREQREAQALRAEIDNLKLEVQSLSENLTGLMELLYNKLEFEVHNDRQPGINPERPFL